MMGSVLVRDVKERMTAYFEVLRVGLWGKPKG
jgi:hypothetical protein